MKILTIGIMLILLLFSAAAGSKLEDNFRKLSQQILENLQSFNPVNATERGIHDYDYRLTDYSPRAIRDQVAKLKRFEVRIHKYTKSSLSDSSRFHLKLLKSNVDLALLELTRIKSHEYNPYLYVSEAINGIYLIAVSEYAPPGTRAQNIIARLKGIPDFFARARSNLENPPPVYTRLAREMLATGQEFFSSLKDELGGQVPELAGEINSAVETAITAMRAFDTFLEEIPPGPENGFAIGRKNFNYRLEYEYFLELDCDSLAALGENLLDTYLAEYYDYVEFLNDSGTKVDSVFVLDCLTSEDILRYYRWETEQTRLFLQQKDLITIPDDIGECRVVETPAFLSNVITSIAYQPPGVYSPVQTGYFYVRPVPDLSDPKLRESQFRYIQRRGFRGSVVHEAYPGHHLQFQMAARVANPIRKWQRNASFYEGWALYCEEMMHDQGFYGDDRRSYLKILRGIIFRAARIVVDVKLHTGQMSRDEAVQWMAAKLNTDTTWIGMEVDRYTLTPTIPMSYLVGKLDIIKLREAYKEQKGDNYSLKGFHDALMSVGSLPPALIWEAWGLTRP